MKLINEVWELMESTCLYRQKERRDINHSESRFGKRIVGVEKKQRSFKDQLLPLVIDSNNLHMTNQKKKNINMIEDVLYITSM